MKGKGLGRGSARVHTTAYPAQAGNREADRFFWADSCCLFSCHFMRRASRTSSNSAGRDAGSTCSRSQSSCLYSAVAHLHVRHDLTCSAQRLLRTGSSAFSTNICSSESDGHGMFTVPPRFAAPPAATGEPGKDRFLPCLAADSLCGRSHRNSCLLRGAERRPCGAPAVTCQGPD